MPDREEIIKDWESILSRDPLDVPWYLIDETLALLKEQEAMKPIPPEDGFGLYRCGKCYHQLFKCVDKYCSRCGQAVKWDD